MKILFVSEQYHPSVGGIETQTRLAAHGLARRHSVAVATMHLAKLPAFKAMASESLPRRAIDYVKAFARRIPGYTTLRRAKHEMRFARRLPRYESYLDGEVPVHALTSTSFERARGLLWAAAISIYHRLIGKDDRCDFRYRFYRAVYMPKLRALMRNNDVVHCVAENYLGWTAEEAARAEEIPFVVTPYHHPGEASVDKEEQNVAFFRRGDIVFALLESGRRHLVDLGVPPERLRISGVVPLLPPTTDPRGFRLRHNLGDKPVVLYVGHMAEYKGYLAVLESAPLVWREISNVHFVFAGPGDEDVIKRFQEFDDRRLIYLGVVPDQEKGDALAACDVFCMPSLFEVMPAVYLEAWTYGKPVVGGSAHGLRELIEGNGAGIVATQDSKLIADGLISLLLDEPRRRAMGECGRALVEQGCTEAALVRVFENAYKHVISRRAVDSEVKEKSILRLTPGASGRS